MRIIGHGLIVLAVVVGVAAALAVSWYFLLGGILDLAGGRSLSSGIGRIDDWNAEYVEKWGRTRVGLLKVFVLEPIALVLIALAARALAAAGRALVDRAPERRARPADVPALAAAPLAASADEPIGEISPVRTPEPVLALSEQDPYEPPPVWVPEPEPPAAEPLARSEPEFPPEPPPPPEPEPLPEPDPLPPEPAPLPEPEPPPVPEPEPEPRPALSPGIVRAGDTLALRTLEGAPVDVTVVETTDPVGAVVPGREDRYVAVRMRVENPGATTFEDMPTGGALVVGDDGERYRTAAQKAEPALREIKLAPGESCDGFLTFKLPVGVQPAGFRFTPNLGLGPETGEWAL
jgi:hypothetical protein